MRTAQAALAAAEMAGRDLLGAKMAMPMWRRHREAANLTLAASRSLGAAEHTFSLTSSDGIEMVVTRKQPQVANQR